MTRGCVAALVLLSTVGAFAQAAFEVVSIRRNTTENTGGTIGVRPGGRWFATNASARTLVALAYGVPTNRVFGGPEWTAIERYVIEAVVGKDKPTAGETQEMVRAMLRDRFNAVVRVEQRELPVYFLVPGGPEGRLGPRLQRSSVDCNDPSARKQAAAAAGPDRMVCGIRYESGRYVGNGVAISTLEGALAGATGRPVLDRTGLSGTYDLELQWTPALGVDTVPGDAVSIFTAVQEQLGLKLESGTAPLDVAVIERIERPSEN